eukprot:349608-Chlamydomonas_euryale.AAC.18
MRAMRRTACACARADAANAVAADETSTHTHTLAHRLLARRGVAWGGTCVPCGAPHACAAQSCALPRPDALCHPPRAP